MSKKTIAVLLAFICFIVIIIFYIFYQKANNYVSESNDIFQEQDKFLFAYPQYEIKERETIIITSRERIDNLDSILGINELIENGFVLVKNYLVEKTEQPTIYHMGGSIFNGKEYLTYAQYDDGAHARVATYYVDIISGNIYLFQAVYNEDSQFDRLVLLN